MSEYPYGPPREPMAIPPIPPEPTRFGWRTVWMWICLGSIMLAIALLFFGKLLAAANPPPHSDAFLILDGFLAFVELSLWVVAGLSGIGWVVSRRVV